MIIFFSVTRSEKQTLQVVTVNNSLPHHIPYLKCEFIHLIYKSIANISVISSYSVYPDRDYSVPFAIAPPVVRWSFVIIMEPFLKSLLPSVEAESSFFVAEYLVCFSLVWKHTVLCNNPLIMLSRSLPISNLSPLLLVMSPSYVFCANSISNEFKFSFRSSMMLKSLGR